MNANTRRMARSFVEVDSDIVEVDDDVVEVDSDFVEIKVLGPPPLHPQYVVITDDCLDCICGCGRTVESVVKEKKARKLESEGVRDAAISASAALAATSAAAALVALNNTAAAAVGTHINIAPVIHLPSSVPSQIKIAPVIHLANGVPIHFTLAPVFHFTSAVGDPSIDVPLAPASKNPTVADVPHVANGLVSTVGGPTSNSAAGADVAAPIAASVPTSVPVSTFTFSQSAFSAFKPVQKKAPTSPDSPWGPQF